MKKIKGILALMRPDLSAAAGICVIMGQLLALGDFGSPHLFLAGFFSVTFISAAILALNDYFDVVSDLINAPNRPIPSGLVSKFEALTLTLILMLLGLILSLSISIETFLTAALLSIVGITYNWKLKRAGLAGNLLVSFSVGMTFIYGGVSVGLPFERTVLLFGLLAASLDLGEEIAADAMDMEGDKEISSDSLAIKYGKEVALRISRYIFCFVVFLSLIPFFLGWFNLIYFLPFLFMDFMIIYSIWRMSQSGGEEVRKLIKLIYRNSTAAILIFIVMRLLLEDHIAN